MRFSRLAQRKRDGALQDPQAGPADGPCEYVDAGEGIALVRVEAAARAQLIVSARDTEIAFSPVSEALADEQPSLTFAGPLYMITAPDASVTLRGAAGEERVLVAEPVERVTEERCGGEASDADAAGELEALRIRCAASERALTEMRAAFAGDSPRLVKAWRECSELRDLLDLREDVHREARREAGALRKRTAQLEAELERLERYASRLEGAADQQAELEQELRSALAAAQDELARAAEADELAQRRELECERLRRELDLERSHRAFAWRSLREAKRRDLGLRLEVERLELELQSERSNHGFARHSLREGKRRELRLRFELEAAAAAAEEGGDEPAGVANGCSAEGVLPLHGSSDHFEPDPTAQPGGDSGSVALVTRVAKRRRRARRRLGS